MMEIKEWEPSTCKHGSVRFPLYDADPNGRDAYCPVCKVLELTSSCAALRAEVENFRKLYFDQMDRACKLDDEVARLRETVNWIIHTGSLEMLAGKRIDFIAHIQRMISKEEAHAIMEHKLNAAGKWKKEG